LEGGGVTEVHWSLSCLNIPVWTEIEIVMVGQTVSAFSEICLCVCVMKSFLYERCWEVRLCLVSGLLEYVWCLFYLIKIRHMHSVLSFTPQWISLLQNSSTVRMLQLNRWWCCSLAWLYCWFVRCLTLLYTELKCLFFFHFVRYWCTCFWTSDFPKQKEPFVPSILPLLPLMDLPEYIFWPCMYIPPTPNKHTYTHMNIEMWKFMPIQGVIIKRPDRAHSA
jgi:hypothetical protein